MFSAISEPNHGHQVAKIAKIGLPEVPHAFIASYSFVISSVSQLPRFTTAFLQSCAIFGLNFLVYFRGDLHLVLDHMVRTLKLNPFLFLVYQLSFTALLRVRSTSKV